MRRYMMTVKPVIGRTNAGRIKYGPQFALGLVSSVWKAAGIFELPELGRWEYLGTVYRITSTWGMNCAKRDADGIDRTVRYTPRRILTVGHGHEAVVTTRAYPPGTHPEGCALIPTCTAVELRGTHGVRWYGVERAWINSELRMVISGFPGGFEELAHWDICRRVN